MPRKMVRIGKWMLVVLAGSITFTQPTADATPATPTDARTAMAPPIPAPDPADLAGKVVVPGRVLDPDGKPFEGAHVCVIAPGSGRRAPQELAATATDADGRFTIAFDPKARRYWDVARPEPWRDAEIVASAPGLGPAWASYRGWKKGADVTLHLVRDLPIEGRVLDLEGRPVAGVHVRVADLKATESEDLTAHLKAFALGEMPWSSSRGLRSTDAPADTTALTDASGRFTIAGMGRERMVTLELSGDTITFTRITVATRRMTPITAEHDKQLALPELDRMWGTPLEITVAPTQPIFGTVRDAATRAPLPGVTVESCVFAGWNWGELRYLMTTSDAEGRYRIVGMPKGKGNQLQALPSDEQPYLMRNVTVPEGAGLDPIQVDIELHKGIWIEGSVTDKVTGEPVRARLYYFPFQSNPHAQRLPEFPSDRPGADGSQDRYYTREDGTFRIPGLPGRAIVGAHCFDKPYRQGTGSESIDGGLSQYGEFPVWGYPVPASKTFPTTMKELDPPEGTTSVTCDLEADPGESVHLKLVDRDGKSVTGCGARNRSPASWGDGPLGAELDVVGLAPGETRPVFLLHVERKLGRLIRVSCDGERSLTVTLEPCATITGRLLDHLGDALTGTTVTLYSLPLTAWLQCAAQVSTDDQGRFTIATVLPGSDYMLQTQDSRAGHQGIRDKLSIQPGETIDLGDVRLKENP